MSWAALNFIWNSLWRNCLALAFLALLLLTVVRAASGEEFAIGKSANRMAEAS